MKYIINMEDAYQLDNPLFIDVRTPQEYLAGKILDAINLPVLDDLSHQEVGELYKQTGPQAAKKRGILYMSQNLPEYFDKVQELCQSHSLIFYCKSGGYRSSSIFGLLRGLGESVYQLEGGYKAYRQWLLQKFNVLPQQFNFISLDGMTGTGKTEILHYLEKLGAQVLDLEGLANHRGSHFGQIGLGDQPSQKDYEARLIHKLLSFQQPLIFVEGESASIGKVHTPKKLYDAYKSSPHQVYIDSPLHLRIKRIKEDYINEDSSQKTLEILTTIHNMNKISQERRDTYIELMHHHNYEVVIKDLILTYYDQHYTLKNKEFEHTLNNLDSLDTARRLIRLYLQ
ncbi:tRNA 2-selenouridine(34) synthase MnmH [Facklamia sp. DSM 111018]|uniref:tRNA 2-selenouridine(34) synthase MnmH n=1 Tax=Facklamia lactis TaxID=2749967 RepID=A0ABS0LR91_9LACT|nr:tRNA 2-selenouridine(34) synthase MnmH [Facklamia lactis]MBG9986680.1 tRNA 2-selenouridine(34) synthase MnmH [Facklamia lactis]